MARALDIRDVFTFAADDQLAATLFPGANIQVVNRLGGGDLARRRWQWFLPVMARTWAAVDLNGYELIVTSSHAAVNAVQPAPGAKLISYCHTPMRYAWDWRPEIGRIPLPLRPFWPAIARRLQAQDRRRAQNVTQFVANSKHVAERIRSYYGKTAIVVYPPVDTTFWTPADGPADEPKDDYFLVAGRLVAYKRADIAVRAAALAGVRLVVAGSGPDIARLKRIAGSKVEFVEEPGQTELRDLYRSARALVFPGVEDFGMTMIEAQACGTPVIAFKRGGALEAVVDGVTGLLYDDPTPTGLATVLKKVDTGRYSREALRSHAERFDARRFDERFLAVVTAVLDGSVGVLAADELADGGEHDL